ncbi:MAG: hypothetical protein P1U54_08390 [Immundisolibacteraceae bacterium]|nr:hypothetical protein [Immundisolibacteraceae bacterium]
MRRRFNYTGRQKILQKHVAIAIQQEDDGVEKFSADIEFEKYQLPDDGKVWIEVYDRNQLERYPFGTISNPFKSSYLLESFLGNDSYYLRIKVVDSENNAKLLAVADSISPLRQNEGSLVLKSLLRVTTRDIDDRPWELEFATADYPLLVINNKIDAGKSLPRSNKFFQALVFPAVVRLILNKILREDGYRPSSDADQEDQWKESWLDFAGGLSGISKLDYDQALGEEEISKWVDDVIQSFCRKLNAVRKIRVELQEIE